MTLFCHLWSHLTLSTWWCWRGTVKWTISNTNRESECRLPQDNAADLSQHLTALQGCARRASLIPSLQGFLRHRTQSDCVPSLYWMSVSIYSFLFVIIVMRSWTPWKERLCPLLVHIIPQVHWQWSAQGKAAAIICWLNAQSISWLSSLRLIIKFLNMHWFSSVY